MSVLVEQWIEHTRSQKRITDALETSLLEECNLSLNEYYVLYFLNKNEKKEMRLNDLQRDIGLSQSAMSRMIARMEDKKCGVIGRHNCVQDKRGIYIHLTKSGVDKLEQGQKVVDGVLGKMLT